MVDVPLGWALATVGDVVQLQRGFDITRAEQRPGSIPVVSSGGVASYHDTAMVQGPGVVIGRKGTLGKVFLVPGGYWPHDTTLWVRDFKGNDPRFVYYWLGTLGLERFDVGSANPTLNRNHVHPLPALVPPLGEQSAISGVLGALDDKIESNRRLWATALDLLEVSRAMLANADELSSQPLGDLVTFNASTLKPGAPDARLVYIDIASVSPGIIDARQELRWSDAPSRARRAVSDGDVIFSTVRPTRRSFSVILDPDPDTVVSTGFAVMTPRAIGTTFLLATVADAEFASYCEGASQGSAYPAVSAEAMAKYEVRLPGAMELRQMESELMPALRRGHRALTENSTLASLRDALLPELLSGRLRVREAERVIEDMV